MPRQANSNSGQSISGRARNGSVPIYLEDGERASIALFMRIRLTQRERALRAFKVEFAESPKLWRDPMIASMTYAIAEIKRLISTIKHPIGYIDTKTGEHREP